MEALQSLGRLVPASCSSAKPPRRRRPEGTCGGRRGALVGGAALAASSALLGVAGPGAVASPDGGGGGDVYASFVSAARRKTKVSAASFDLGEAAVELRGIADELARQKNFGLPPRYRELRASLREGGLAGLRKALVAVAPEERARGTALLEELDAALKDGERGGNVSVDRMQDGFAALADLVGALQDAAAT